MIIYDQIELVIVIFIVISAFVTLLISKKFYKARKLLYLVFFILVTAFCIIIYSAFIEPNWIESQNYKITLTDNRNIKLNIAVISDLHLGPYKKDAFLKQIVTEINKTEPDLVLIPGDFIFSNRGQAEMLYPIKDLKSRLGVFAVLGNHDYGISRLNMNDNTAPGAIATRDIVIAKLQEANIKVLVNENVIVTTDNQRIKIAGIDDLWGGQPDINSTMISDAPSEFTILLSHNPDVIEFPTSKNADLVVSGHTHGGQLQLPIWGPVVPLPVNIGNQYDYGMFEFTHGKYLIITKGLGEMGPRNRLLARPEIVYLSIN